MGMFDDIPVAEKSAPTAGGMFDDIPASNTAMKPKEGFSWAPSLGDIGKSVGDQASESWNTIKEGFAPEGGKAAQGVLGGTLATGKAIGAAMAAVPAMGYAAVSPLIARPMAKAEHEIGNVIAPKIAALDDPEKMYQTAKGDAETAMMAAAPRGFGPKGALPVSASKITVPTTEALHDAAEAAYKTARGYGVEIHPQPVARLADDILSELHNEGFRERNVPKSWSAIEELKNPAGKTVTIDDLDSVRKALRKSSANPTEGAERDAARRAIDSLDNYMASLDPSHIAVNPHFAPNVAREMQEARANWAAYKRAQTLENKEEMAIDRAASTGSGANINNAMRQKIREILASPKQRAGFSGDEIEQMRRIVRGTPVGNVARLLGKLAPSGVVSGGISGGIGYLAGGLHGGVALPAIGAVAKKIGDLSTARQLGKLDEMVRQRSPVFKSMPQVIPPPPQIPSYLYPSLGIGSTPSPAVPAILRQLQGTVPVAAEEDQKKARGGRNNQPNGDAGGKKHGGKVSASAGTRKAVIDTARLLAKRADGGTVPGMLEPGNVDLNHRPRVKNSDGTISTVRSMGINDNGQEVLIPTVRANPFRPYTGWVMDDQAAEDYYRKAGQKLGVFDTPDNSDAYARSLHEDQERIYAPRPGFSDGGYLSEDSIASDLARRAAADRVRNSVRHMFAKGGRVDPSSIDHEPSEAQKNAGNYAKDHVRIHGLDITIENARGKMRRGVDKGGKPWEVKMPAHYGYIKGTVGKDKDHVDVYVGPVIRSPVAFVIDQKNSETGKFDEHKCFVGFATRQQVISIYKKAFSDGKAMARLGHIREMTIPDFKEWLARGDTTKPIEDAA